MRFLATAVLCRKRWLSLPVSTMWQWCVNGLDSPGLLTLLQDAPCARFDVVVLSDGRQRRHRLARAAAVGPVADPPG